MMYKMIKAFMPFLTEVLVLILTLAVFTTMFQGELDKSIVFILLIIAVQLEKIADVMKEKQ
jgi:hypothetical protein